MDEYITTCICNTCICVRVDNIVCTVLHYVSMEETSFNKTKTAYMPYRGKGGPRLKGTTVYKDVS